jgi:hypothetical protein
MERADQTLVLVGTHRARAVPDPPKTFLLSTNSSLRRVHFPRRPRAIGTPTSWREIGGTSAGLAAGQPRYSLFDVTVAQGYPGRTDLYGY